MPAKKTTIWACIGTTDSGYPLRQPSPFQPDMEAPLAPNPVQSQLCRFSNLSVVLSSRTPLRIPHHCANRNDDRCSLYSGFQFPLRCKRGHQTCACLTAALASPMHFFLCDDVATGDMFQREFPMGPSGSLIPFARVGLPDIRRQSLTEATRPLIFSQRFIVSSMVRLRFEQQWITQWITRSAGL
jgi:hypothetical protein